MHRCPRALLRECGWWSEFFEAFVALERWGIWPEGPRLADQSPSFVEAATVMKTWITEKQNKAMER